jgi:hypothetical protein
MSNLRCICSTEALSRSPIIIGVVPSCKQVSRCVSSWLYHGHALFQGSPWKHKQCPEGRCVHSPSGVGMLAFLGLWYSAIVSYRTLLPPLDIPVISELWCALPQRHRLVRQNLSKCSPQIILPYLQCWTFDFVVPSHYQVDPNHLSCMVDLILCKSNPIWYNSANGNIPFDISSFVAYFHSLPFHIKSITYQ